MRFLLDENIHGGLLAFLRGLGHDATFAPKGLSNGALFAAAVSDRRVLLTHDRDFAERPPATSHPGIVLLKVLPKDMGQLKAALQRLLADKPSPELLEDRLMVVFRDRHDDFPFRAESIPTT